MTAQRRPAATTSEPSGKAKISPTQRRIRQDREDRDALDKARAAHDAGALETIGHAELKSRLGLD